MTKEKIESVCRAVEIYIQSSAYYKECIIGGNFSGRFNEFLTQEICNQIVRQHEKLLSQLKASEYENGHLSGKVSDLVRYISDLDEDFKKEDARNNELTDKVAELELGIGILEDNLDAAQEKISEYEEAIGLKSKHIQQYHDSLLNKDIEIRKWRELVENMKSNHAKETDSIRGDHCDYLKKVLGEMQIIKGYNQNLINELRRCRTHMLEAGFHSQSAPITALDQTIRQNTIELGELRD